MKSLWNHVLLTLSVAAALLSVTGCLGGKIARGYSIETGGNADRGAQAIQQYGCGSCHMIPGINRANGLVGPPLMMFGRRTFIAGEVANTPNNLVQWIQDPQSIEAGTAMPNMGVSEDQARDIAAYLYTLR